MPAAWGVGGTRHPKKVGNNFRNRTVPNTVLNRDVRRKEMLEEPTT